MNEQITGGMPDVVRAAQPVDAEEVFLTLPTGDDGVEVQISQRPIYEALSQLSFTLCNGDGWAGSMPAIAWYHFAEGIDPYESYIYSTYEEVLVDLYVVAALCVPHGWWPVELDDPELGWGPHLRAWTLDEWNDHQRCRGYLTIPDPSAALDALAESIAANPAAVAEWERKRAAGAIPVSIAAEPALTHRAGN